MQFIFCLQIGKVAEFYAANYPTELVFRKRKPKENSKPLKKKQVTIKEPHAEVVKPKRSSDVIRDRRSLSSERTHEACCPTTEETARIESARDHTGVHVFLEHSDTFEQVFHQVRCASGYDNRICKFISHEYRPRSKCQQQYAHVSALGRTSQNGHLRSYRIAVPSGCKCVVQTRQPE